MTGIPSWTFAPLEAGQAEFLRQRRETVVPLLPEYSPLVARLLGLAGLDVVLRPIDQYPDVARLRQAYDATQVLQRGRSWIGPASSFAEMQSSNCHLNVAQLRAEGRGEIVTGWALADDGLWREHSWVLSAVGSEERVLETTVAFLMYHGYVLTPEEATWFVASELGSSLSTGAA